MKQTALLISVLSLLLMIIGCGSTPFNPYIYKSPESINDGLDVGTLREVDMDPSLIEKAVDDINRGRYNEIHSMLIYKDNKLVFEEYFPGHEYQWDGNNYHGDLVAWDRSTLHCIHSDTKSITSACIGIAIDKGFIKGVHQSIFDYLPEHQHLNTDGKDKITIEHLLTMTSGLDWQEWSASYSSKDNPMIGIWFSDKDPITYILERSMKNEPGTRFTYYGGNMILLGEIIRNATGMDIDEFSAKYLFEPLGIDSFDWWNRFDNGVIEAASGLKMTPRDMVKVGAMFMNKGVWKGNQIISELRVEKSAATFSVNQGIDIPGEDGGKAGYGYSWWNKQYSDSGKEINLFWALGWGGQKIMVLPEVNSVVVFTGGSYTSEVKSFSILEKYIIPALN